jgi:peptide/nickel transport system ATP-binding protein
VSRYPHQLSGGERQRVAFARALVTQPHLILADEPTQMLDASLRAELVDLLDELRSVHGVAVLHITHDLALAQRSCDRLVVLQAGRVVEEGPTEGVLARPRHPYTAALLDAARRLHPQPARIV